MLFKLLYLPASLDVVNRSHFSDYDMVMWHKKKKTRISKGFFLSGFMSRLAKKTRMLSDPILIQSYHDLFCRTVYSLNPAGCV